jgi:hypothetical protein
MVLRSEDEDVNQSTDPVLDGDLLAHAIQSELQRDARTAALPIEVEVWDRVVHLRGVGAGLVVDDLEVRPTRPSKRRAQ